MIALTSFALSLVLLAMSVWFAMLRMKGRCYETLAPGWISGLCGVGFGLLAVLVQLPPGPAPQKTELSYYESETMQECARRPGCDAKGLYEAIMKSHGVAID